MSDSHVYIQDKDHGWLPANVLEHDGDQVKVKVFSVDEKEALGERTVSLKDYPNASLPLQNVNASGELMEMADMVDLPSLHEAAILYNLRARHFKSEPYTRVGDLIIAVNPFQWMEALYAPETRQRYVDQLIWNATAAAGDGIGNARSRLPPHVYETSCGAFRGLAVEGRHQSILVSGESGAGKTESVKIVMTHLASVQAAAQGEGETEHHHAVVQRVLDSHPLLEAFGNAKTVRNDNSSRFGKFIQMQFDVEDATTAQFAGRAVPNCVLAGSTCETYLLEKSRVVGHEEHERTYHVFYQLLAAPDEVKKGFWEGLVGKTNESFRYVGTTETLKIEGKTDAERWEKTLNALAVLEITGEKLRTLMRAVCMVMQLGNIVFEEDPSDSEKSVISSTEELAALADVSGIDADALEKSLTYRTVVAGKETYTIPLKLAAAQDACDAFAKEIYQQAFDWLVKQINEVTCAEANYDDASDVQDYGLIGLLDIFGFECFQVNRFEQLCINYTNEKLQQKYTLDIFRSVQEEYSHEGIELGEISFDDNAEVLRLIEGRVGIISVLNEECVRPNGNDTAFVSKVKSVNSDASCLVNEKLHKPTEFAIQHYAGHVKYDATSFVQKNTDALPKDLIECACLSTNELIKVELKAAAEEKAHQSSGDKPAGKRGAATLTVTTKFKHQLSKLMHDVAKTQTRYIRCIKPNPEKVPLQMNMSTSAEQLRCAGVVAAVTISRVAFPNRLMHETALERFACLGHVDLADVADEKKDETETDETGYRGSVDSLLSSLLKEMEVTDASGKVTKAYAIGRSRVYFRTGALEFLEAKRLAALGVFATAMERIVRGFTARSMFWKTKYAAIDSQANARRTIARMTYLRVRDACISIECWVRCVVAAKELTKRKREKASIRLQSRWRAVAAVAVLVKCKSSAITIQKVARGAIQRPKYRQSLKEAEEEARVNTKLAALQKRLQEAEMKWIQADRKRIEAEKRAEGLASPAGGEPPVAVISDDEGKKPEVAAAGQQIDLIDESNEMLEYFRKEVFRLKSANYLLRVDLSQAKEENKHLVAHNQSLEASQSAMKQNMTKMSQNNMKMAVNMAGQKEAVANLKQELKMEKIRLGSEVKKLQSEAHNNDRLHDMEVTRLKRELERMRKVVAKTPAATKPSPKYERASFGSRRRHSQLGSRKESSVLSPISRSSSMADMSVTSNEGSLDDWGSDSYHSRNSPPDGRKSSTDWNVGHGNRESKPPHPYGGYQARRRGRYGRKGSRPPVPTTSLAAAASSRQRVPPTSSGSGHFRRGQSPRNAGRSSNGPIQKSGSHTSLGVAANAGRASTETPKLQSQSSLQAAAARKTAPDTPKTTNKKKEGSLPGE